MRVGECPYRDVLKQMNWIVFNVVSDEKVICYSQKSHLWDGEDVHKLLHFWSLCCKQMFMLFEEICGHFNLFN